MLLLNAMYIQNPSKALKRCFVGPYDVHTAYATANTLNKVLYTFLPVSVE